MVCTQHQQQVLWTLEEYSPGGTSQAFIDLPNRPVVIGRSTEVDITIASPAVSKRHAEIRVEYDQLIIVDLASTNGTFVNGKRIDHCLLRAGDLLQFANSVYRLECRSNFQPEATVEEGILEWAQSLLLFERLLSEKLVVPHFQPIIALNDIHYRGYELLARSDLHSLANPALMFAAAERLGQAAALSELMRSEGLRVANSHECYESPIFVNTHPSEVGAQRLIQSLQDLRAAYPSSAVVVEIHEAAIIETTAIDELRAALRDLGMQLAYDDFGAGQGRLRELGECPPDVLKFDMQFIRNIDAAPQSRQDMLASLVRLATDLGASPLAEGVETESEHRTCEQLGFEFGQGYFYGRPTPWNTRAS